jgi:hypothetical protein
MIPKPELIRNNGYTNLSHAVPYGFRDGFPSPEPLNGLL